MLCVRSWQVMDDHNTKADVERIRREAMEYLRHTAHAPGVQMQYVPPDTCVQRCVLRACTDAASSRRQRQRQRAGMHSVCTRWSGALLMCWLRLGALWESSDPWGAWSSMRPVRSQSVALGHAGLLRCLLCSSRSVLLKGPLCIIYGVRQPWRMCSAAGLCTCEAAHAKLHMRGCSHCMHACTHACRYNYDADEVPPLEERLGKYGREHMLILDPEEDAYGY